MDQIQAAEIRKRIVTLPGHSPAMLDRDLAECYGTTAKNLNKAVKRNLDWFDQEYFFQIPKGEVPKWNLDWAGGHLPLAYTHAGCNAAAFILRTPQAKAHRQLIISVFTELERSMKATEKPKLDLPALRQIVNESVSFRMLQLASHTTLTDKEILNFIRYQKLGLSQTEIALLLSRSRAAVQTWTKLLRKAQEPLKFLSRIGDPSDIQGQLQIELT